MKHIYLFEAYMDVIDNKNGLYHEVYSIDNDWVLKIPRKSERGETEMDHLQFDFHIQTMKSMPAIFPKVKKLNR